MSEFDLIRHLQATIVSPQAKYAGQLAVGIGDDAAVINIPEGQQLVVSTDTLVAGVHYPPDTAAADVGYKALAVNLSDLAAMGADPAWFFLALTLPEPSPDWLREFAGGMAELAGEAGIVLAGGDTTSGPHSITVTVAGLVPSGQALLRDGAQAGDLVVVSGTPGLAGLGLRRILAGETGGQAPERALNRPQARLALGRLLCGHASSCIDLSDGLLADLTHITRASGVGAEVRLCALPWGDEVQGLDEQDRWNLQLAGGDDYELCFTLPPQFQEQLPAWAAQAGVSLTVVGQITAGTGVTCVRADGREYQPARRGFEHFSTAG